MSNQGGKHILDQYYDQTNFNDVLVNLNLLNKKLESLCPSSPVLLHVDTHLNYIKNYHRPTIPMAFEIREEPIKLIVGENSYLLPLYGDFMYNMTLVIRLGSISTIDPGGCAYYHFPAHRLIKSIRMEYAGNLLDRYIGEAYNVHYAYMPEDQKEAYRRAVGEQEPIPVEIPGAWGEIRFVTNGLQTFKSTHGATEFHIPLLFDFSQYLGCSFFSAKVPYGQRYLKVELNPLQNILQGIGVSIPTISGGLIIEHVFVDPIIKSHLLRGSYKTLIRVHKEMYLSVNPVDSIKLDSINFPVDDIYFGVKPNTNTSASNWYRYSQFEQQAIAFPYHVLNPTPLPTYQLVTYETTVQHPIHNILTVKLISNGIDVFAATPSYIVSSYGKNISTSDIGLYSVTFSNIVGNQNICGYFKPHGEFYIDFTSAVGGQLYVLAKCINWLVIDQNNNINLEYPF